ncbi:hypothetical protein ACFY9A_37595 [Streptomyces rubradiris]|uniref:hypothetical protein n=1 Tax=Streptomyces rubradiris TaxID=285531 RepID=UPI0036E4C4DF
MTRLPGLGTKDLDRLGLSMPALRALKVALTTRGGSKYHLPRDEKSFRLGGGCRHRGSAEFATLHHLLEVISDICLRCRVQLPGPADALWRVTALVAGHVAELERVRDADAMKTWLGYARYAARLTSDDEAHIARELERATADPSLATDAAELSAAWRRLLADRTAFLEQCADACPPIETFNGAHEAVKRAADAPELAACAQVSAAVGPVSADRGLSWRREEREVRAVVCRAWQQARSRGASAAQAAELARAAAGRLMDKAVVRDVTALPEPVLGGERFTSPAAWATAELAVWWPKVVAAACRRLEEEFEAETSASASRLLLISDWPLTYERDADVAYLATSARFGPAVPFGYRQGGGYGDILQTTAPGPSYAVVVAAPENIVDKLVAEQDELLGRFDTPRFQAGVTFTGGKPPAWAAEEMLREAFPYLPADADGEDPTASDEVEQARAVHATASEPLPEQWYDRDDLFRQGFYIWTPDRDGGLELLKDIARYRQGFVRLDLECGRRNAEPFLASVFGTVRPGDGPNLEFSAAGRHGPLTVPLHRVVAVTGAPDWKPGGSFPHPAEPLWQLYSAPERNRYRY